MYLNKEGLYASIEGLWVNDDTPFFYIRYRLIGETALDLKMHKKDLTMPFLVRSFLKSKGLMINELFWNPDMETLCTENDIIDLRIPVLKEGTMPSGEIQTTITLINERLLAAKSHALIDALAKVLSELIKAKVLEKEGHS